MAKLEIRLKQYTPLIHFQWEQKGAILRASEVKPRLDKFLKQYVFEGKFENYKYYLIGYKDGSTEEDFKGKEAFDYKLRIITDVSEVHEVEIKGEMKLLYFANMGKENCKRKGVLADRDVILEFFTFHNNLKNKINENIESFLAINNFGSRQSKGFGSFYVKKCKKKIDESVKNACVYKGINQYLYIEYNKWNYSEMMSDISVIYPLMKSGINYRNHNNQSYYKGFLFKYMLDKNIGNEKRFIKENFFKNTIENDGKQKKYVRAMLGICDGIRFRDNTRNGKIKYKSDIDRFQSPILFKIIENKLFIIPQKIPQEMFNKEFKFSNNYGCKKICTPNCDEFNLEDFLCDFAKYFSKDLKIVSPQNMIEQKLGDAKQRKIHIIEVNG